MWWHLNEKFRSSNLDAITNSSIDPKYPFFDHGWWCDVNRRSFRVFGVVIASPGTLWGRRGQVTLLLRRGLSYNTSRIEWRTSMKEVRQVELCCLKSQSKIGWFEVHCEVHRAGWSEAPALSATLKRVPRGAILYGGESYWSSHLCRTTFFPVAAVSGSRMS